MSKNIRYVESESMTVQGKIGEISKKYGDNWNIKPLGGGNGNWLLTKRSDVLVDGKSYRDFILDHYGKSKLTQKLFEKFCDDVKNGKVTI